MESADRIELGNNESYMALLEGRFTLLPTPGILLDHRGDALVATPKMRQPVVDGWPGSFGQRRCRRNPVPCNLWSPMRLYGDVCQNPIEVLYENLPTTYACRGAPPHGALRRLGPSSGGRFGDGAPLYTGSSNL